MTRFLHRGKNVDESPARAEKLNSRGGGQTHAEPQAQLRQLLLHLVQRRLTKISHLEQLVLAAPNQIAHGVNVLGFEAIGRADRQLQVGQAHVELRLQGGIVAQGAPRRRVYSRAELVVLHERVEVLAQNL